MRFEKMTLFVVLLAIFLVSSVQARKPRWDGLAGVAVSPDQKTVVVGGQNRTLYFIDTEKKEVTKRHWLGSEILECVFTDDGKQLIVETQDEEVLFLDRDTLEVTQTIKGVEYMVARPEKGIIAVRKDYTRDIGVYSTKDASEIFTVENPDSLRTYALGISPDGKQIAILTIPFDAEEPESKSKEDTKDLSRFEKEVIKQKSDGKKSRFMVYNVDSKELIVDKTIWFKTGDESKMAFDGQVAYVTNYHDVCAKITIDGDVTPFQLHRYGYGLGYDPELKSLVGGSLRKYSVLKIDTQESVSGECGRIKGWPEYYENFAYFDDDSIVGVTSAFRLVFIKPDGTYDTTVPVY